MCVVLAGAFPVRQHGWSGLLPPVLCVLYRCPGKHSNLTPYLTNK